MSARVLAAAAAAALAAVLLGGPARHRPDAVAAARRAPRSVPVVVAGRVAGGPAVRSPRSGWAAAGGRSAAGSGGAVPCGERGSGAEAAAAGAAACCEICDLLASELAGRAAAGRRLARAAVAWPALRPVVDGVPVWAPTCPPRCAGSPRARGADDLRLLAAAWQVAHRTGAGSGRRRSTGSPAVRARQAHPARGRRRARLRPGDGPAGRRAAGAGPADGLRGGGGPVALPARAPRSGWPASRLGLGFGLAGLCVDRADRPAPRRPA